MRHGSSILGQPKRGGLGLPVTAGNRIVALIPARGGSKGLPRKNIRLLGGKPLIASAIQVAQASELIDRVMVSTEDAEIAGVAREFGAEGQFETC